MKVNRYLPAAYTYFFFNAVALPFGLTYMALMAPFFYGWMLVSRRREMVVPFLSLLVPFMNLHLLFADVDVSSYAISLLNLLLVYVVCQAVYTFLLLCRQVELIFWRILQVNFVLCLVALPFYFSSSYYLFWDEQVLTSGVGKLRRLRLFTYEPSYYALLFTPIFSFFLLQYLFKLNRKPAIVLLPMLFLPYLLSLSIGVMVTLFIAVIVTTIFHFKKLLARKRIFNAVINCALILSVSMFGVMSFFRGNPVLMRLGNILQGDDSSAKGRTVDAFQLALKMLGDDNRFWGIGLGQIKLAGADIVKSFYQYNLEMVITIPNAAAETLAIFGWSGLVLRLSIELALFFATRVWSNYYRLLLFIFIFVYQFTGSFITNIAEYVLWILAFTNVFPQFDVKAAAKKL